MQQPSCSIVLLSPHCDDIALSLGGWIAKLRRLSPQTLSRIGVYTAFSWSKSTPRQLSTDGNSVTVTRLREQEERDYCERAGVSLELGGLPDTSFLNIGYRDALMVSKDQRYEHLKTALSEKVKNKIVIAPLSLGEHLDHRIVFECARHLEHESILTLYYEDLPYAGWYDDTERKKYITNTLGEYASPITIDMDKSDKKSKIDNLNCYASQMNKSEILEIEKYKAWGKDCVETLWVANPENSDLSVLKTLLINP